MAVPLQAASGRTSITRASNTTAAAAQDWAIECNGSRPTSRQRKELEYTPHPLHCTEQRQVRLRPRDMLGVKSPADITAYPAL